MEYTTTREINDSIIFSIEDFKSLYHCDPEQEIGHQLYFDGFSVIIEDIDRMFDMVIVRSNNYFNLAEQYE